MFPPLALAGVQPCRRNGPKTLLVPRFWHSYIRMYELNHPHRGRPYRGDVNQVTSASHPCTPPDPLSSRACLPGATPSGGRGANSRKRGEPNLLVFGLHVDSAPSGFRLDLSLHVSILFIRYPDPLLPWVSGRALGL